MCGTLTDGDVVPCAVNMEVEVVAQVADVAVDGEVLGGQQVAASLDHWLLLVPLLLVEERLNRV
jgi:hypothetical protein